MSNARDLTATLAPTQTRAGTIDIAVGFCIAAILPAIFWSAAVLGIGHFMDWNLPRSAIFALGAAITIFLGMVFAAINTREKS